MRQIPGRTVRAGLDRCDHLALRHALDALADTAGTADFYALLGVDRAASGAQLKAAYHAMLLAHHPDKNPSQSQSQSQAQQGQQMDFALLKLAYETLASPERRRQYDAEAAVRARAQRPAEVVSLDEWEEAVGEGEWRHPCRCGRAYVLREADLERGVHLVGCEGCSEVVWAGYALAEE